MSPVPVATQMPVSKAGSSCSSAFISNLDHLDLKGLPDCKGESSLLSCYNAQNARLTDNHSNLDMGCFDASSMLFSHSHNTSFSNSSHENASTGHHLKSELELFDSFSLDKLNSTFSTNSFYDVLQYDDSLLPYGDYINFDDDESDEGLEDDLKLVRAINSDENDSENDHLASEFDSISTVAANTDALIAIRELAFKEKRQQQRKHKNSTSSVSSMSMSSTIKKVLHSLVDSVGIFWTICSLISKREFLLFSIPQAKESSFCANPRLQYEEIVGLELI